MSFLKSLYFGGKGELPNFVNLSSIFISVNMTFFFSIRGSLYKGNEDLPTRFLFFFEFYLFFLYSRFLLVIYFIHISVYMSIPIYQFIPPTPPPPFPPLVYIHLFFLHLCLYFCLANPIICTILLDSTYMH